MNPMWFIFALFFACFAVWFWRFIYGAIVAGVVYFPKSDAWWREARFYDRASQPVRFWITIGLWVALALLITAIPAVCLTREFE